MNNKIITLLGFASKAGKLSYGFDTTCQSVKQQKAKLVVCAEDISPKSFKEITFFAEKSNVSVFSLKGITIATLSQAIGRKCGMISVNEKGFAQSLKEEILNDK